MPNPNEPSDFWKYVEKIPGVECWIWNGHNSGYRYGAFHCRGRVFKAHRFSWELHNGAIPNGMHVLHHCDVGFCVRPDHLFIGTHLENMQDRERKHRGNQAKGERNGWAKLTEASAMEIIRRWHAGERQIDLAAEFSVLQTTISKIVTRTSWKHLPEHQK